MRSLVLTVVLALLSCGAHAQVAANCAPEIPSPPGAELVTEINLSDADILGMIKQAIPAFAQSAAGAKGEAGAFLKSIDLNTLADAIQGIKAIRAAQFKLQPGATAADITSFYQGQLTPTEANCEWNRILFDSSTAGGKVLSVYSRGGQDFFGVGVDPKSSRAFAFRTVGFVDIPRIAAWGGQVLTFVSEMEAKKAAAKKPVVKPKATPAKKPVKPATRKK